MIVTILMSEMYPSSPVLLVGFTSRGWTLRAFKSLRNKGCMRLTD